MDHKAKSFDLNGERLEVRAIRDSNGWVVRCFRGDQPIGLRYSVESATDNDFRFYHGMSAVDELMRIAESDLRSAVLG